MTDKANEKKKREKSVKKSLHPFLIQKNLLTLSQLFFKAVQDTDVYLYGLQLSCLVLDATQGKIVLLISDPTLSSNSGTQPLCRNFSLPLLVISTKTTP